MSWKSDAEKDEFLYFDADYSYKFLDKGIIGYGKEVTV